jgi:hypothetical protein
MGKKKLPQDIQDWIEARRRFHLSHAHVQMAIDPLAERMALLGLITIATLDM